MIPKSGYRFSEKIMRKSKSSEIFGEDHIMAADGTWNLTMQTPMGERR